MRTLMVLSVGLCLVGPLQAADSVQSIRQKQYEAKVVKQYNRGLTLNPEQKKRQAAEVAKREAVEKEAMKQPTRKLQLLAGSAPKNHKEVLLLETARKELKKADKVKVQN